jgi:integrase
VSIKVFIRRQPDRKHLSLYYRDPITRKERTRSAGTADKGEAERAAARWEAELLQFHGADGSGWQAFRDRFHDEHLAFKAANTKTSYNTALTTFERLCHITGVNQITSSMVSTYAARLLRDGYPHSTVANYLTHLRAALRWAENIAGMMRKAPHIRMPRGGVRTHMRGRPLTWRQLGAMLRACRRLHPDDWPKWRELLKLLWWSGLRISEVVQLSWEDPPLLVLLDAKPYPLIVIDIEGQKNRTDTATPLAPDFAAWLARTPKEERRGLVCKVLNDAGKPYTGDKLSDEISLIGQAAVKPDANGDMPQHPTAHDFRRSFGSRWALKVRPMTLQRMMRHKDFKTTLLFYVGLSAEDVGAELWADVEQAKE